MTVLFASALLFWADLLVGQIYPLKFVDVDGNTLSTADGHVTVVVLTITADVPKAQTVSDRVPDYCLANPTYRMITIVNFQKRRAKPTRMILSALMRHRLNAEAQRLQVRYTANKISGAARRDVFAVADFDGVVTNQLGARFESAGFHVFVFGRDGALLRQWNDVPSAEELSAVVR